MPNSEPNPFDQFDNEPVEPAAEAESNPFDQFDTDDNPFDQFDEAAPVAAQESSGGFVVPELTRAPADPGVIDMAGRGFMHGVQGMAESVGTGIQYLGGKVDSDYLRTLGKDTADYWEESAKKYQTPGSLQGSVLDNPKLMAKGSWWAYNVAGIVPTIAASIVPGMAGARAIEVFGTAVKWAPALVTKLARLGGAISGGVVGGGLEGANTYKEVLAKGGTEDEAETAAELMTLASGVLNTLSVDKWLKALPKGALSRLKERAVRGLTEGITEWLEGPAEAGIMYQGGHITPEEAVQKIKDELNVLGPAAVTGFFFPGAGRLPSNQQADKPPPADQPPPTDDMPPLDAESTQDQPGAVPGVGAATEPVEPAPAQEELLAQEIEYFDPRLGRENYRDLLEQAADDLTPDSGGELIPDMNYTPGESDPWDENGVPIRPKVRASSLNPEWFQSMMTDPEYKMSVAKVKSAVKKAIKGKPLGVRQARVVAGILDKVQDDRTSPANMDYAREQLEKARAARRAAGMPESDDWLFEEQDYPETADGDMRAWMEMEQRAQEIGLGDEAQAILESQADDETINQQLAILISEVPNEQQIQANAEINPEPEAGTGVPGSGEGPVTGELAAAGEPGTGPAGGFDRYVETGAGQPEPELAPDELEAIQAPVTEGVTPDEKAMLTEDRRQKKQPGRKQERRESREDRRKDASKRKAVSQMDEEEMREALLVDELTGLGNKRAYDEDEKLDYQIFIDLDGLKYINDTHGHEAGDQLLKSFGKALGALSFSYHLSGDEFVLQSITKEGGESAMDMVKNNVEKSEFEWGKGVQFSYGIGKTLAAAEKSMYAHKKQRTESGERVERGVKPVGKKEPVIAQEDDKFTPEESRAAQQKREADDELRSEFTFISNELYKWFTPKEIANIQTEQPNPYTDPDGLKWLGDKLVEGQKRGWPKGVKPKKAPGKKKVAAKKHPGRKPDFDLTTQTEETRQAETDAAAKAAKKKEADKAVDGFELEGAVTPIEQSMDQGDLLAAANEAATSPENNKPLPTEAQKEAGNYKKGHITINGLDVTIENPAGSKRNPEWPTLKYHYGYIRGTEGKDGDHVDVFLNDDAGNADLPVVVIDQINPKTGVLD
ncbi:MAG TPA: diguanylate cyclase, partial [Gammaproteobacteria bacterium]|nr:diguanylate cyclase [Gammaproteobacteria bacterium]